MKALIDTTIVRYREKSTRAISETISNLYRWLDKLKWERYIHLLSTADISTFLIEYKELSHATAADAEYKAKLHIPAESDDDKHFDELLFVVYKGWVDVLITEDGRTKINADYLGLSDKVYTINRFVSMATQAHPEFVDYKALAVKKEKFENSDVSNQFFDSFRQDYPGFDDWFKKKAKSDVYVCRAQKDGNQSAFLGFLFLKPEDENEDYSDITPRFAPKKRLKVGTFKVESTGFRLGERFIKIVFDNALRLGLDEIYVTLFKDRPEVAALYRLFLRWGFEDWGTKGANETVLVKKIAYDENKDIKHNFPAVRYRGARKLFLPIKPEFHAKLIPDSERGIQDYVQNEACRYALEKVYITTATHNPVIAGDLLIVYRMGDEGRAAYTGIVTTVGVVKEIKKNFRSKDEFMKECQNRSVFSDEVLNTLWKNYGSRLGVVRFIVISTFEKRPNLKWLWDNGILEGGGGPRPFTEMSGEHFKAILQEAGVTAETAGAKFY